MASRNVWVWAAFGTILVGGIAVGYAPDLMLANALRSAKEEGLLVLAPLPEVRREDDARLAFERAAAKFPNAPNRLGSDFARQVRAPDKAVAGYLEAMALASARPGCSAIPSEALTPYGNGSGSQFFIAGKALIVRAKDGKGLLPAARIASHLRAQRALKSIGYGAVLTNRVLDCAATLGLGAAARRTIVEALGPTTTPHETLRRRLAERIDAFERETREEGPKVSRTRREAAYLHFWRDLLAAPDRPEFVAAVRNADAEIREAEARSGEYLDLDSVVGASPTPWGTWAEVLERANARIR